MDPRQGEQWFSKLFRISNSLVCFTLAYILFTYGFWFVTALVARWVKFDSFVYYYGIKFILNGHRWTAGRVALIYSAGPAFTLLGGLLCLMLYNMLGRAKTMIRVFLLWGFTIGTSMFVSQGLIAILGTDSFDSNYYQNLAVVFSWWRLPVFFVYLVGLLFFVMFLYFAVNYSKPFLTFAYSYSKVNRLSRRRKYFFETALAPFIIGCILTTVVTFPVNVYIHYVYLGSMALALTIGWYSLTYVEVLKEEVSRFKAFQSPNIVFVVLLIISWVFVFITFRGIYIAV